METPKAYKLPSIGSRFKTQIGLQSLSEILDAPEPGFLGNGNTIHRQFCCDGAIEAIRTSSAGYTARRTISEPEILDRNLQDKIVPKEVIDEKALKSDRIGLQSLLKITNPSESAILENDKVVHRQFRCGGDIEASSSGKYTTGRTNFENVHSAVLIPGILEGSFHDKTSREEVLDEKVLTVDQTQIGLQSLSEILDAPEPGFLENGNTIHRQFCCDGVIEVIRSSSAGYTARRTISETEILNRNLQDKNASKEVIDEKALKSGRIGLQSLLKITNPSESAILENDKVVHRQYHCGGVIEASNSSNYTTRRTNFENTHSAVLIPGILEGSFHDKTSCEEVLDEKVLTVDQTDLEENKTKENVKLDDQSQDMPLQVAETSFLLIKEQDVTPKEIEEAPPIIEDALVLINDLMKEVSPLLGLCIQTTRETRALEEANTKLEQRVEELTCLLEVEKQLRTNLEETKVKENVKLQDWLYDMQSQVEETNSILVKEEYVSLKDIEEADPIMEDAHVLIYDLMKEISPLLGLCIQQLCNQTAREIRDLNEAKDKLEQRVEELTLTLEVEKQLRTDLEETKAQENAQLQNWIHYMQLQEEQTNSILVKVQDVGLKDIEEVLPVVEEARVLIHDLMEDVSPLLGLCRQTARETKSLREANNKLEQCVEELTFLLEVEKQLRIDMEETKEQEIAKLQDRLNDMQLKVNKGNSILVKEQEAAMKSIGESPLVIKDTSGLFRDLQKEISPLLALCIQAPRRLSAEGSHSRAEAKTQPWHDIVKSLTKYLNIMRASHVRPFLVRQVVKQIFSYINVQLFNRLLQSEFRSFSNREYLKAGLAELEHWCTDKHFVSAWDELKQVRQAVGFFDNR